MGSAVNRTGKRLTPKKVFEEFEALYPSLSKDVVHWYPANGMDLVVYLKDGSKVVYERDLARAVVMEDRWKL